MPGFITLFCLLCGHNLQITEDVGDVRINYDNLARTNGYEKT